MTTSLAIVFNADLADLHLSEPADNRLSTAIENRAETMLSLGCSLDSISSMAAEMVERDGHGRWPVMVYVGEDACEVVLGVLTEASAC